MGLVGGERESETILCLERTLLFDGVGGHAENGGAGLGKFGAQGGKRLRLPRAAGCVSLRVKVENEFPAGKIGERYNPAVVARQAEVGSRGADGR